MKSLVNLLKCELCVTWIKKQICVLLVTIILLDLIWVKKNLFLTYLGWMQKMNQLWIQYDFIIIFLVVKCNFNDLKDLSKDGFVHEYKFYRI